MPEREQRASTTDGSIAQRNDDSNRADSTVRRPGSALGIDILWLRLTAAGYMLDLRYRVTDPDKAAAVFDAHLQPCLLDQRTGAKLVVPSSPKVGPLPQTPEEPKTNRTYFLVFANPDRFLKMGDKVTLAFGDHRVKNLVIE